MIPKHMVQQFKALFQLETRKILWGRRGLPTLLIAFLPVGFFLLVFLVFNVISKPGMQQSELLTAFATIFQVFILRSVLFFGAVWIFMNLFRADMLDKSLHYFFLSPIRREWLVVGKYLAGLVSATLLFTLSTTISILLFQFAFSFEALIQFFTQQQGFLLVVQYDLIIFLGCLGYGSLFLLIGLMFRNAIVPAVLLYLWEWINFLLPSFLKKVSVIYYLKAMAPVPVAEGPLALAADPISAPKAIIGLILFSLAMNALAVWKIRKMELQYGKEN